ncbi:MAG: hypothetical protein RLY86_1114 [Pseudomonadota bacterium]
MTAARRIFHPWSLIARTARALGLAVLLLVPGTAAAGGAEASLRAEAVAAMRRATTFMLETVAHDGGYVWAYTADLSRRWGELEAYPTMVWIQPPGTATMGHVYLDALAATGDEFYYRAAEHVAGAVIRAQHPAGGWNYMADTGGEDSLKRWYATIGANAWRMEEFHHYHGNATFDDEGTAEAARFLLRLYLAKRDPRYRPPLDKAIAFILDSQYPMGGWPQRWPLEGAQKDDYSAYITFNDDVASQNIRFLLMVRQTLGEDARLTARLEDAIRRGMDAFLVTQGPPSQPGWGLQYTPDLQPAGARTYEPRALVTHTTAANLTQLMDFYELTGDRRYLARIGEGLDWLEKVKLPPEQVKNRRTHPTFIEIGTDRPLYVHRRGSNVVNGEYYVTDRLEGAIGHYSPTRAIDLPALRARYARLLATPPEVAVRGSPLHAPVGTPLPRFFSIDVALGSDLNSAGGAKGATAAEAVRALIDGLNDQGYWPTPLRAVSNPYAGPGPATPAPGDFATTRVGDHTDTSPYITETPEMGISTGTYIQNMGSLIAFLAAAER